MEEKLPRNLWERIGFQIWSERMMELNREYRSRRIWKKLEMFGDVYLGFWFENAVAGRSGFSLGLGYPDNNPPIYNWRDLEGGAHEKDRSIWNNRGNESQVVGELPKNYRYSYMVKI